MSPSPSPSSPPPARTVSLVTLGCARNEVDSEELAARLTASGWELTSDGDASVVLVNTCGFIENAKQESIDTILSFEDRVDTVAKLCKLGHAGKLVLSQDAGCFNDWLPERDLAHVLPRWNYFHILNDVIPALMQLGVTRQQIDTMLIDNPRAIFSNQTPY